MKLFSKNNLLISLLSSALSTTFLISPGHTMDVPEDNYWTTNPAKYSPRSSTISLPDDPFSAGYYNAMQALCQSNNPEDKERGSIALRGMAADISHPHHLKAISYLFSDGTEEDKQAVAFPMRKLAQNHHTQDRWVLATQLLCSQVLDNQEVGRNVVIEITQNETDPHYREAVIILYYNAGMEEYKKMADSILEEIREKARKNIYPKDFLCADILFFTDNEEDIKIATSIYNEIIQDGTHPRYLHAVKRLLEGRNPELPESTLCTLVPLFSLKTVNNSLSWCQNKLLHEMLESPYPNIHTRAEAIFLENPLKFMDGSFFGTRSDFLIEQEESKKNVFLQRICEALDSASLENLQMEDRQRLFNAAYLVLQLSDQEKFVTSAKRVFLKLMDKELVHHIYHIRPLKDTELRERVFSYLFTLAESINLNEEAGVGHNVHNGINEKKGALLALLKQDDETIRRKAITLCQRLIESINPTQIQHTEFLSQVGLALNKIEEGKAFSQQLLVFCILSSSKL
jgi:hypothetical protein